jgi:Na+-driven multidrug efflux pump
MFMILAHVINVAILSRQEDKEALVIYALGETIILLAFYSVVLSFSTALETLVSQAYGA